MEDLIILNTFETPKRSKRGEEESCLDNSTLSQSEVDESHYNSKNDAQLKRGRPRAEVINHLIIEGSSSHSSIRCDICNRVFPREKSLQAHKRIHTGEKPYICDYPMCGKAFTQSGQLKTHQRLHTGEKPFICTVLGCNSRFTHANRHCPDHPFASLRRCHELALQPLMSQTENSPEVLCWLENFKKRNDEKTPGKSSDNNEDSDSNALKRSRVKRGWSSNQQENNESLSQDQSKPRRIKGSIAKALQYGSPTSSCDDSATIPLYRKLCEAVDPSSGCTPLQWSPRPTKLFGNSPSRCDVSSGYESMLQDCKLNSTLDSSREHERSTATSSTETPRPEKPKRRWLREALTNEIISSANTSANANLTRPTVLMMANKACPVSPRFEPSSTSTPAKPSLVRALQNAEKQWTGAIALMQLATSSNC